MTPQTLRSFRLSLSMTVVDFADFLEVNQGSLSQWENGKRRIPRYISRLVTALKEIDEIKQPKLALPIAEGLCQCNCGQSTVKNWRTDSAKGWIKGKYRAYVKGHNASFERAAP